MNEHNVWLLKANTIGSDLPLSRIKWLKNILICWRSQRRSERLELRSWETSTVLAQLGFPQMCQLMGQLRPTGSSQRSPARHNCTWDFRLQSRKFSCTQRHSGKWAVTETASLGEMEREGGWYPYTCMELFSPWIRRKNGFPGDPSSSCSTRYANYTKDNLLHWQTVRCK